MAYKDKEDDKEYHRQYYQDNKESIKAQKLAYNRKWRKKNSDKLKNNNLKYVYGITLEDYEKMLEDQDGVCKICKQPETGNSRSGGIRLLAVDHNHKTDKVRELLCQRCNSVLGYVGDDPALLRTAAAYLEDHATNS